MRKILIKHKYFWTLLLITFFLLITNYKPQTYILGWDTTQTDLNPLLGVKRALFFVWVEFFSFGALAGMAHASDLVRAVFVFFLSFILPQNLIRYFFHFFMVFLGGVGAYKLFSFLNKNPKKDFLAFLGAVFYMFNLGTVQIFYVPFEPFSTFFASLPWLIWIFLKLLLPIKRNITKKELPLFLLINFLATPSFYTQQLFVVYLLILGLIFLGIIIKNLSDLTFIRKYLQRSVFLISLILIVNSFWLLPQIYFLKTSSNVVYEAKANQLATEDVYFQNKEKGTLKYFLRLEGFYYDLFDKNNQPLFAPWKEHFKIFWPIQYFFAFLMLLGLLQSIRKKNFIFAFPLFFTTIVFLNSTWPISEIDQFLRQNKLYNQIFRSPFTKFIIPYSLLYSYFLTKGFEKILSLIKPNFRKALTIFFVFLIILYSIPSFKGFFISPEMKVKIPQDYFELIEYFKKEDKNKRIALLPEYTLWGWFFTRWGLNGSGFLWYGIEQPIVSRTFDVWSNRSESYFWEIKTAVETEDLKKFESVLEKYDIDYLLLDYSLLPVVGSMKGLSYDRLETLLETSRKIELIKKWNNLALFKINKDSPNKNFINLKSNLPNIWPRIKLTDLDNAYLENGDYKTTEIYPPDIIYPFLDLTTQNRVTKEKWQIKDTEDELQIVFKSKLNLKKDYVVDIKRNFSASLYENEEVSTYSGSLKDNIQQNTLKISIPKILLKKVTQKDLFQIKNCWPNVTCFSTYFPNLPQRYSYLIKIKNKNLHGRRLFFYVLDATKKQEFLEDRLKTNIEYYILPPKYQYGLGYSITFHQNDYENLKSKNLIESIEIYLFPYENLKSLKFIKKDLNPENTKSSKQDLYSFETKKHSYFLYEVKLPKNLKNQNNLIIYLSQSYHPGWKAYQIKSSKLNIKNWINTYFNTYFPFIFGKEIKEHVLVNNWANGWEVNKLLKDQKTNAQSLQVILIFWPQYLEFLGFLLLILTLSIILIQKDYKRKKKEEALRH